MPIKTIAPDLKGSQNAGPQGDVIGPDILRLASSWLPIFGNGITLAFLAPRSHMRWHSFGPRMAARPFDVFQTASPLGQKLDRITKLRGAAGRGVSASYRLALLLCPRWSHVALSHLWDIQTTLLPTFRSLWRVNLKKSF
jgi:hypothetical protein